MLGHSSRAGGGTCLVLGYSSRAGGRNPRTPPLGHAPFCWLTFLIIFFNHFFNYATVREKMI